jgi:alkylation response protein AidB-like acyl-CoA dehydrogenase
MGFGLSQKHLKFKREIRELFEREVRPIVQEIEEKDEFPFALFKRLGQLGLLGILCPREYGGLEKDNLSGAILAEEMGRVSIGGFAGIILHALIITPILHHLSSEEQRQGYLVPAIKGQKILAMGLTEPDAGSDFASIRTVARLNGEHYILNGSKIFTTNGTLADFLIIAAVTAPFETQKARRISLFLVEKGTQGFSVSRKIEKLGWHGSDTAEIYFDDCKIRRESLLGEENNGFYHIMDGLNRTRVPVAAMSLGVAQGALEEGLRIATKIKTCEPNDSQRMRFVMADLATELEAARLLVYQAAWLEDRGSRSPRESSMAKLYASELANKIAYKVMEMEGGSAITKDSMVQRFFRDARVLTIVEGTSEIQREIIARQIGL